MVTEPVVTVGADLEGVTLAVFALFDTVGWVCLSGSAGWASLSGFACGALVPAVCSLATTG